MSSNNTLGMQYSECDSIISSLESAIIMAEKDLSYIIDAENLAYGCRPQATESICTAKISIKSVKEDIEKFKEDFKKYYTNVSDFDEELHKSFRKFAGELGTLVGIGSSTEFGLLSTGKDGLIGVNRDIFKSLSISGCKIVEKDGYYIIKGLPSSREGISALKDIKGTRYKIGSNKYFEAGIYKYLPEGASLGDEFSKFGSNIGKNIEKGFKGFGSNTFKFVKQDTIGNTAKGLGYISVAAGVGKGIYENYEEGADAGEYTADIVCDTAKGLGSMAAASAGAEIVCNKVYL